MEIDVTELEINNVILHVPRDQKRMIKGRELYYNDNVVIERVEKNDSIIDVNAFVEGKTSSYYVQMQLDENEVINCNCTCMDNESGNVCKHIYSVLYEINDPHRPNTLEGIAKQQEEERLRRQKREEEYEEYLRKREYQLRYHNTEELINKYKDIYSQQKEEKINLQGSADLKKIYKNIQEIRNSGSNVINKVCKNVQIVPIINEINEEQLGIEFKIGERKKYVLKI